MKSHRLLTLKSIVAGSLLAGAVSSVQAQAPAAPAAPAAAPGGAAPGGRGAGGPGGGGGRGGGGAPAVPIGVAQMIAARSIASDVPAALTANQAAARTALTAASLTDPRNDSNIRAKADLLAAADQALANAKADLFQKVQNSANKLNAEQVAAYVNVAGGGGGLGAPSMTMAYSDYSGFMSLFDGKTLKGWDGETDIWSVDHEAIHSDNSPGRPNSGQQHHIIYVGPGHIVKDFDLKVEFKLTAAGNPSGGPVDPAAAAAAPGGRGGGGGSANGGIQYRSRLLTGHGPNRSISDPATIADPLGTALPPGVTTQALAREAGINGQPWQVSGYQFDLDSANGFSGQLYEGQGRSIVTGPGKIVQLLPTGLAVTLGNVADSPRDYIKAHNALEGEWNQAEIIARGNTLIHMMNGHVISMTIDDDPARRASQGIISVQLEGVGKVWYRNIYLKNL